MKLDLDKYRRVRLNINFDFNQATIRPDAKPILSEAVVDALVAAHILRSRLTAGGFGPDQISEA
jgi:hypothetical protein